MAKRLVWKKFCTFEIEPSAVLMRQVIVPFPFVQIDLDICCPQCLRTQITDQIAILVLSADVIDDLRNLCKCTGRISKKKNLLSLTDSTLQLQLPRPNVCHHDDSSLRCAFIVENKKKAQQQKKYSFLKKHFTLNEEYDDMLLWYKIKPVMDSSSQPHMDSACLRTTLRALQFTVLLKQYLESKAVIDLTPRILSDSRISMLYKERLTQVETKLNEVRMGRAQEYLVPLDELQENCSIRIEVAGFLRQYRLTNIRNNFEAEEQAANQNFNSEKMLVMDRLKDEIEEKIRMLEEDRNNVDISADLWVYERSRHNKRHSWRGTRLPEDNNNLVRRKPTVVSGPYIVYMLRDADILEDWAIIKKAATVCKRKSEWSDGNSVKKDMFRSKYQKDQKYQKDSKYHKERKLHFPGKPGQKLKLW
ncbi:Breast cancer metastasis-suppressor 1-like protein [Homalodisca vitripennis]|nr:Breast cancer metastasis-suppressor 1-like protein [Homalodisca vitripennis]